MGRVERKREERNAMIVRMFEGGITPKNIQARAGMSMATVYRVLGNFEKNGKNNTRQDLVRQS